MEATVSVPLRFILIMSRARRYCFTLNNWTDSEYEEIIGTECKYVIVGKEEGEAGTRHLQGYIEFPNQRTFSSVKSILGGRVHVEAARGTAKQNIAYCSKEGDYEERGIQSSQGSRTDLQSLREIIKTSGSIRKCLDQATSYQAVRAAELIAKYEEAPRSGKPNTVWLFGPSGSGKTKDAWDYCGIEDTWIWNNERWFDGYDGHGNCILDDLRPDDIKFNTLLRILDRYPVRVPTKGGFRQWRPHTIIITSTWEPRDVVPGSEDRTQLLRRLDRILDYSGPNRLSRVIPLTQDSEDEDVVHTDTE